MAQGSQPVLRNAFFNGFVGQVLLSTVPVVLVIATLPLYRDALGISSAELGFIFLCSRTGGICGAQLGPYLNSRLKPHLGSALTELLNFIFTGALFVAIVAFGASAKFALFPILLLKGICTGLIPNIRATWLKQLPDPQWSKRVLVICATAIQSSYGITGVLIILGLGVSAARYLILFDALSSLVGAAIFLRMGQLGVEAIQRSIVRARIGDLFQGPRRTLLAADFFLALGMGGTNIFLAKAGADLFGGLGGYGSSLLVYALGFLLGGWIVQGHGGWLGRNKRLFSETAPWLMAVAALVFLMSSRWPAAGLFGMFLLFLFYPIFLLSLETTWFDLVEKHEVSRVFAFRALVIAIVLAVGEAAYARMPHLMDVSVRIFGILAAGVVFSRFRSGELSQPFRVGIASMGEPGK